MNIPILIVDDDDIDRYLIARLLKKLDSQFKVFEEINGTDALEFLTKHESNHDLKSDEFPPVLIFLDVNMPLMNGLEFLQNFDKIRVENDLTSVAIIMFSGAELETERLEALHYEYVKAYVVKGEVGAKELGHQINSIMSLAS